MILSYIISIDPSLNSSGITVFNDTGTPAHYECILPGLRDSERLLYNYNRFCNIFETFYPIKCISFECQVPQMRFNHQAKNILALAENIGILKLAIQGAIVNNPDILVLAVPPGDIKSFATGNSKSDKTAMINAVDGRHIKYIRSIIPEYSVNDVADSYHLCRMTIKMINEGSYHKYIQYAGSSYISVDPQAVP